jgi:hypothetical protein
VEATLILVILGSQALVLRRAVAKPRRRAVAG